MDFRVNAPTLPTRSIKISAGKFYDQKSSHISAECTAFIDKPPVLLNIFFLMGIYPAFSINIDLSYDIKRGETLNAMSKGTMFSTSYPGSYLWERA